VEHGFLFCGEASDGELAFPMIQKLRPDIIITDIRMPFMDGLELSRLIKQEFPGSKIIILSGYGEFEYAKEAINIGVTEYLLKPISSVDLVKCLKKVSDHILKEQQEKINLEKFKREMSEYEEDEKRRLFIDLVNGTSSLGNLLERGKELNLNLSAMAYNIILFTLDMQKQTACNSKDIIEIEQELSDFLEQNQALIKFNFYIEGIAILIKGNSEEEVRDIQDLCFRRIKEIMKKRQYISYFGGIGSMVKRLGELPISFREASRASAYRYIWDTNEILDSSQISQEGVINQKLDTNVPSNAHLNKNKVEDFIRNGNKEDIKFFVGEYLKSIGMEQINSVLFRTAFLKDMYSIVNGYLEELGEMVDFIENPFRDKTQINRLVFSHELTQKFIEDLFCQAMEYRDEILASRYNDVINKAKDYIQDNYQNEELSLNMVSSSVFISPSHFSAIFSQRTGETFIKYLTDLRMKKAKELLRCTDMRTSDVGYSVGYKDPHYFSYLFKKTQNTTPKQYRYTSLAKEGMR
jgi:two-component system response regulator YesN